MDIFFQVRYFIFNRHIMTINKESVERQEKKTLSVYDNISGLATEHYQLKKMLLV